MLPLNEIITGDARELAREISDESIALIFTDPPYLREYLPLYHWLTQEAARVLVPGGWLFAYGPGEYIPDVLDLMRGCGLTYFWIFALLHNGGYPRVWYKNLMSGYKPVFVFTKGKPSRLPWQASVGSVAADKQFHEWGQGVGFAFKTIDILTSSEDTVWDPFVGGGTTAAACKMLGRNYLAFEIDPGTAQIARDRLLNTQPPLFVLQPEQLSLDG